MPLAITWAHCPVESWKYSDMWCDLIANILICGLNSYKGNVSKSPKCVGCVLVLVVSGFENLQVSGFENSHSDDLLFLMQAIFFDSV
jgi:hypothetical protein